MRTVRLPRLSPQGGRGRVQGAFWEEPEAPLGWRQGRLHWQCGHANHRCSSSRLTCTLRRCLSCPLRAVQMLSSRQASLLADCTR